MGIMSLFAACSDKLPDEGLLPEWNKSRTMRISVVGKSGDGFLVSSGQDEENLVSLLKKKQASVLLLRGCTVSYGEVITNPLNRLADQLRRIAVFVKGTQMESGYSGCGFLLNHTLTTQVETLISSGCRIKSVETFVSEDKTTHSVLSTVSIESEEDLDLFVSHSLGSWRADDLMIGFIKNDLFSKLQAAIESEGLSCHLREAGDNMNTISVFVLSGERWLLRDVSTEISGEYTAIDLQVEQLS